MERIPEVESTRGQYCLIELLVRGGMGVVSGNQMTVSGTGIPFVYQRQ